MVAANALSGDMPLLHWDSATNGFLLDVRELSETAAEEGPEALNILVGKLRPRLGEFPRDREITATSTSTAALASASISQRESFFRTDSRAGTSQAQCSFWRTGAKSPDDGLWRGRATAL
jgi:rhodanese-related sulfurtransferase